MAYTTIDDPSAYFNVKTYTGTVDHDATAGSTQSVTWDATEDFAVNLLWVKGRSHAQAAQIADTVRGGVDTSGSGADVGMKKLQPSADAAEVAPTANTNGGIKSIDSDGFTLLSGDDSSDRSNGTCRTSYTYVAWGWKESADAGFDIVSWTGNGSSQNISHSLSAVPHFMITKNRSATGDWSTYHKYGGGTKTFYLSNTDAIGTTSSPWNDTTPTSSVFSVGGGAYTNGDGNSIIGYLWTEKQGFSKFGSYTGNGNADGPFIYTGFRPAWFLTKKSSASGNNWTLWDNKRDIDNPLDLLLHPNNTNAENDSGDNIDFCSNGVKLRNTAGGNNASGATYIFMAFAEAPFVNSEGVPCNAR